MAAGGRVGGAGLSAVRFRLRSGDRRLLAECRRFLQALLSAEGRSLGGWSRVSGQHFALKRSPHVFSKSQENFGWLEHRSRVEASGAPLSRRQLLRLHAVLGHYYPGVEVVVSWHA